MLALLAVFGAGLAAGVLNVLAGGGSLITLPVLLFLGLPAPLANGTNRVAILVQNLVAVTAFRREGHWEPRAGAKLALAALPGAIVGAFVSLEVPEWLFRGILAVVLLAAVATMAVPPRRASGTGGAREVRWWGYLAFVGIGFYGGFIQAGVGMAFLVLLFHVLGLDLLRVNVQKVFVVAVYTVPALAVFAWSGNVDWVVGGVLAAGNGTGALVGTRLSVRGGERPVRIVVAAALVLMAVRLVWP